MGRSILTREFAKYLTNLFKAFEGGKMEFMAQIPGVTDDRDRAMLPTRYLPYEGTNGMIDAYYCTVLHHNRILECYSYGDDEEWHVKF